MKKWLVVTALVMVCLICTACEGEKSSKNMYDDLSFPLGVWGENQRIGFEDQKNGDLWVVNEVGEKVLDVTDVIRTEILGDEFTGEPRLIKVYMPSTVSNLYRERDFFHAFPGNIYPDEGDCFSFNYYDTFGNLLLENSRYNLVSISNTLSLSSDYSGNILVHRLDNGVCLGSGLQPYPVDSGVLMSQDNYAPNQAMVFVGYDGELIANVEMYPIVGYLAPYIRSDGTAVDPGWVCETSFGNRGLSSEEYASLLDSRGSFLGETDEEYKDYRDDFWNSLEERYGFRVHRDSLLIFRGGEKKTALCGLMNDRGEIVLEPNYLGFCSLGDDMVVAFDSERTEFYRRDDFSLLQILPYEMTCCDWQNGVVRTESGMFYLSDEKGSRLSGDYDRIERIDMEEYGVCFIAYPSDASEAEILDPSGSLRGVIPDHPVVQYAGDGELLVTSDAGTYTADGEGHIRWVLEIENGYWFDREKDVLFKAKP